MQLAFEIVPLTQIQPIFWWLLNIEGKELYNIVNFKGAHQTEYESCMDLKSRGIFVSGKFKFSDGSEELCSGWGKDM